MHLPISLLARGSPPSACAYFGTVPTVPNLLPGSNVDSSSPTAHQARSGQLLTSCLIASSRSLVDPSVPFALPARLKPHANVSRRAALHLQSRWLAFCRGS